MIVKIEHIAIMVNNLEESIRFYTDILGFKVRFRKLGSGREIAFLQLNESNKAYTEIELIQDIDPTGENLTNGCINHIAFTVKNIESAISYLKEKGISFNSDEPKVTVDGGKMILFYGPDRELLQLIEKPIRYY